MFKVLRDVEPELTGLLEVEDWLAVPDELDRHVAGFLPFQDGNGRVGRLIAFKECLKYGIVPFIIEDTKKSYYYRGLREWKNERGFLLGTCLDGQDTYKRLLDYFGIKYDG